MHCTWKESEAYRYAEGSLEPQREEAFADHLRTCAICRERGRGLQRVESARRHDAGGRAGTLASSGRRCPPSGRRQRRPAPAVVPN